MPADPIDLASPFCSRLCHDLRSPVGAMSNGLELLADESDEAMRQQVMGLLADSARTSANKLKFFRLAFGAAGGVGDVVDVREAKAAIEGLLGGEKRIQLGWMVAEPALAKTAIKVLLNLSLIAADALVRGGRLDVGAEGGEIVIRAEGPRVVLDQELRGALVGEIDAEALTPRAAAAWLVHQLVAEQGGEVMLSTEEEGVLLFGARLGA